MIQRVPLKTLSAGVVIPPDLRDRCWYDPQRRELCFDGFMSKAVYDRLERLDADFDYKRAMEQLFRSCTPAVETAERTGASRYLLLAVAVTGLLASGLTLVWLLKSVASG